ncbi:MAG: YlxR family protein [Kofleriaceae bacterium]|nr:YlxR family protein [Myxococcales bacterium]MCB9573185.1 YlxR family protein [Kofleriaceae bacterium]
MTPSSSPTDRSPERTCVGCRKVAPQRELVRVCLDGSQIVVDEARRHPGRGAWVHPSRGCVHNAARGGLARSFRKAVDTASLLAWAEGRVVNAAETQ